MNNSAILYEGVSHIDNVTPIVCVITGLNFSSNSKTGNVLQTYIIRQDIKPTDAVKMGLDGAICGTCKFSGGNGCYVNIGNAPTQIYKAYKAGKYKHISKLDLLRIKGRVIRLGSYGEITAIPYIIVHNIVKACKSHLGYTHRWNEIDKKWSKYLMASVDNIFEKRIAKDMNYRCFETLTSIDNLQEKSVICPATSFGGFKANCDTCGLCSGTKVNAKDIGVVLHGVSYKVNRATKQILESLETV